MRWSDRAKEAIKGSAVVLAVIVAGYLSTTYVDHRFAVREAASHDTASPSPASSACVDDEGRWRNWPWANVPMLSPACRSGR
ncbi:hypothetical protein SSBR45G_32340 [Bradyrhizobium sp. SSBR45G]|uniref:hypothetical protein n=1 Tax=unclassified Bradyrhizobium TaxID=2631580 RepID=UPI0023428DEB|nr:MULTISPECIES: hypothetical protein [unclassified Bradyrhizobium]GLH78325.1 hypothetical protein SSBR45G_32340 [Bradyrhizobium sp. SSBR45G]GLH86108.1 hypothetical protein SSBR45R_35680 [Bradyrhizobium sp. SSBR45R]